MKLVFFVAESLLRTWTLTLSPAGASHTIGGTFSSLGIAPTTAPGVMLPSSMMVSLPENTVTSWKAPAVVTASAFMMSFSRAGQGRYSYCQPERMLGLMTPAAMAMLPCFCGIGPPGRLLPPGQWSALALLRLLEAGNVLLLSYQLQYFLRILLES